MTQQEMLSAIKNARDWTDKAEAYAKEGNLAGAYTMLLLSRDSITQGVRDYNEKRKQESEAA